MINRNCIGVRLACIVAGLCVSASEAFCAADLVMSRLVARQTSAEWCSVSADGAFLSFTDEDGNLSVRDLRTAAARRITTTATSGATHITMWAVFSRDGKDLAYYWADPINGNDEIRTVHADGTGDRTLTKNPGRWTQLSDWSPDGTQILATRTNTGDNSEIVAISVPDGAIRTLSKQPTFSGRPAFSADGHWIAHSKGQEGPEAHSDVWLLSADGKQDVPLVRHRADDTFVGWSADGSRLLFASDRAGSLGLWSVTVVNGKADGAARLIKADIGRLRTPVGVTRSGAVLFSVDATTTDIYTARLDLARKTATFEPEPIAQHNTGANSYPSWSPDGESFVYLSSPDTGGKQIYTHESSGAERSLIPVLSWFNRLEWLPSGQVAVTGGDQSGHEGIFGIDSRTGETKQLIDRTVNETAFHGQWTKDGQTYYGRRRSAADGVYRLDVRTGEKKSLFVPMAGWQAQGGVLSPDERTLASEIIPKAPTEPGRILLIDTGSGKARELISNSAATHFPCCRPMTWTADSQNLIVVSGDERNRTLFLVPVNGGSPKALISMPGLANPHLNRDNVRLLFEMGDSHQEIWQIAGSALE